MNNVVLVKKLKGHHDLVCDDNGIVLRNGLYGGTVREIGKKVAPTDPLVVTLVRS